MIRIVGVGYNENDDDTGRRLRDRDPTLWDLDSDTPELVDRLGWVDAPAETLSRLKTIRSRLEDIKTGSVVLLGMGGSSLAPAVIAELTGRSRVRSPDGRRQRRDRREGDRRQSRDRRSADSEPPDSDRRESDGRRSGSRRAGSDRRGSGERRSATATPTGVPPFQMLDSTHPDSVRAISFDDQDTVFVVSSKSGGTIETSCFEDYFLARSRPAKFVAVTDPGTPLEARAGSRGYATCIPGPPDVGGRFSALTEFGVVPAMLSGIPVEELLAGGVSASKSLTNGKSLAVVAGRLLGNMAEQAGGSVRVSILCEPSKEMAGLWLDQLLAESTGKDGKGIIPLVGLGRAIPETTVIRIGGREWLHDSTSGQAEVHCAVDSLEDLGAFFYEMEVMAAVAASILKVHPFNQPNVAESKERTERLLASGVPGHVAEPSSGQYESAIGAVDGYAAVLAYAPCNREWADRLRAAAARLVGRGIAATWNFGPRYLHSSGQLHKGGPPVGTFIQIVAETDEDLPIPDREYGFAHLMRAQADGDFDALVERGLPVIRFSSPDDIN